jgi:hypothetical protein
MAENYNLIFGANASQSYTWSDVDYQKGWETVGDTPPLGEQFDALQRRADNKAKDLNDRLTPIETNNTNTFRQPSTAYALKDIRFYSDLPAGWYLECSVDGTTDSGAITLPATIVENAEITDGTVTWTIRKIGSGGGEAVGVIKAFAGNGDIPSGYLLCDGSAVSRTMFPDLFSAIGTTYGAGDGSTTFNVPDYNTAQRFAQGSTVAGTVKQAGLPNITGGTKPAVATMASADITTADLGYGCISISNLGSSTIDTGSKYRYGRLDIDASRSSSIYGNSDTVQPNALTTRYIIKAFDGQTADSALIDITQYAQELATKANRQLSNLDTANLACHVVVDSYYDATTGDWWREYDDGWIEQGGRKAITLPASSVNSTGTINLLKPVSTLATYSLLTDGSGHVGLHGSTTTTIGISFYNLISTTAKNVKVEWVAYGMGASA